MKTKTKALEQVAETKENYYSQCFSYAKRFVRRQKTTFTCEDVINGYNKTANPKPSNNKVWGSVMHYLRKAGLVNHKGYALAKNPSSHQRPISVWVLND